MANHGLIVGLEIGTNTIKALAADVRNQQVNIVAVGRAVSHGVKKGVVVDIEATASDIQQAMAQINEQAGQQITDVIAALPAGNIQLSHINGQITVQDSQHISYQDVKSVVQVALKGQTVADREVVDLVPLDFAVDDFDGIQDPNDMVGMRLSMNGIAYTAPKHILGNLKMAIAKAGLNLRDCVLTPLAASKTVLSEAEQEFGSVFLDMGAGQTTAAVIQNNQIKFISSFPAGGDNITRDISTVLSIGGYDAEMLKLDSGVTLQRLANKQDKLMIQKVGQAEPEEITQDYLAEVIEARVDQILDKLGDKLQMVSALNLPGGIIISGGTAALSGMPVAVQERLGATTKCFAPDDIGLHHPGFTNAWAVIQYAAQQLPIQLIVKQALYGLPLQITGQPVVPHQVKTPTVSQSTETTPEMVPTTKPKTTPPASLEAKADVVDDDDAYETDDDHESHKKSSRIGEFFREFFD